MECSSYKVNVYSVMILPYAVVGISTNIMITANAAMSGHIRKREQFSISF